MLTDPEEQTIVSSLGWVDGGALWIFDVPTRHAYSAPIGEAKYISLHAGRSGHFAAVHHYDDEQLLITAHSFAAPEAILSRFVLSRNQRGIDGPAAPWEHLPRHYVAYLVQPAWSDFALVSINPSSGIGLQTFHWYDNSYDKGYQGIVGVTEIPGSERVLVSVQRSSKLIIYDPMARHQIGDIALSERSGNPSLYFRRSREELWADDYDTLVKVESGNWRILKARKLQAAAAGTGHFIGQFTFNSDESICAVARPFSGDVVGLEPETLHTRYRAQLGRQPLEVALLSDRRVYARDWKTGDLLEGRLRRTWAF